MPPLRDTEHHWLDLECQITKWHNISSSIAQNEEASGGETHQSPVEMPKVTRRLLPARRLRKRAMAVEDRDSGEFTLMDFVFWFIPDVFFSAHQLENNLVPFSALDLAFQTPARPVMRPKHVLSEIDRMTPRNTTARNIYSPIVRFVTPSKESAYSSCLLSLHHCVFNNAWQKKNIARHKLHWIVFCWPAVLMTCQILSDPKIYCETIYCKY